MSFIQDTQQDYKTLYGSHHALEDKADSQIERLEKRLQRVKDKRSKLWDNFPSWYDFLLKPIVEQLSAKLGAHHYEISGPFGLSSESPVFFYKDAESKAYSYIYFIPLDLKEGQLAIRDYSRDTGQFLKGTIAEVNGMNHPTVLIPDDADINWLSHYVLGGSTKEETEQ